MRNMIEIGRIIIIVLLAFGFGFFFLKLGERTPSNEERTVEWIFQSPKPIVVYPYEVDVYGATNYTLINSQSGIFVTGPVKLSLPDTIK
jgi:hypothetical protein